MLFLIIALGTMKPATSKMFTLGSIIAIVLALMFTVIVPRMYPWGDDSNTS